MENNIHTDLQNLTKAANGLAAAIIALTAAITGHSPAQAAARPTTPAPAATPAAGKATPAPGGKTAPAPGDKKAGAAAAPAKAKVNLKEPPDPLKGEKPVTETGEEPALNKDEVRNLLKSVNSRQFSMDTLARFGVTTLSALDAKHYPEVAEMVRVELERQANVDAEAEPGDPTDE